MNPNVAMPIRDASVARSVSPSLFGRGALTSLGQRDIRAMWALEECGVAYETIGLDCGSSGLQDDISFGEVSPFKQVPVIDDDGFILAGLLSVMQPQS
jgi:hypothetical protein